MRLPWAKAEIVLLLRELHEHLLLVAMPLLPVAMPGATSSF